MNWIRSTISTICFSPALPNGEFGTIRPLRIWAAQQHSPPPAPTDTQPFSQTPQKQDEQKKWYIHHTEQGTRIRNWRVRPGQASEALDGHDAVRAEERALVARILAVLWQDAVGGKAVGGFPEVVEVVLSENRHAAVVHSSLSAAPYSAQWIGPGRQIRTKDARQQHFINGSEATATWSHREEEGDLVIHDRSRWGGGCCRHRSGCSGCRRRRRIAASAPLPRSRRALGPAAAAAAPLGERGGWGKNGEPACWNLSAIWTTAGPAEFGLGTRETDLGWIFSHQSGKLILVEIFDTIYKLQETVVEITNRVEEKGKLISFSENRKV